MRARIADIYNTELSDSSVILPVVRPNASHVYHLYVVRSKKRDLLKLFLADNGVGALIHYPVPIHRQPAYSVRMSPILPETELAAEEVLSLPMYPELAESDAMQVARLIQKFDKEQP